MSDKQPARAFSLARLIRKSFVSAFVVFTYVAYAVHERFAAPAANLNTLAQAPGVSTIQPEAAAPQGASQPSPQGIPQASQPKRPAPTVTSAPSATASATAASSALTSSAAASSAAVPSTSASQGLYKNGTYTGASADAFYGQVQVRVVIQNGKISDVQILNYPSDRRTSQRINSIAIPYLQTEAIQAQSANVDIISGATLTSEAFAASLQSALNSAKS